MRVLVGGSTGLIGGALVARLESQGHTVHRLVRGKPADGQASIDVGAASIDAGRMPGQSLEGLDAVVNLAGEPLAPTRWSEPPRWSRAKKERIYSSRVETTELIARVIAGLREPPPVFVSASAIGYYGDRGDEILVEGTRPGDGYLAGVCVAWEAAAAPAAAAGIRVVTLRSGVVLAAAGGFLKLALPLFKKGLGGRIGSGGQWTSWISLEDEVGAIEHAIDEGELAGAVNVVAPAPARNAELTEQLARTVGRPALLNVPAAPLQLALGRDASEYALASQRVLPRRLERSGYRFAHPDLAGALAAAIVGTAAGAAGEPGSSEPHRGA